MNQNNSFILTMLSVLKENQADMTMLDSNHWIVRNTEKNWEIHIYKDVPYPDEPDCIWEWQVDKQYFSQAKWAVGYLTKLILEKNTGIRTIKHPKRKVPEICGVNGAACRNPNKCNSMICTECPVAEEFFAKRDGVILRYMEEEND